MKDLRNILVTTDLSDTSTEAIEPALALARKFDASILVAYVEEDRLPPLVVEYVAVGIDDLLERQVSPAAERLDQFVRDNLQGYDDVEVTVEVGTPHIEIVRLAEERGVDLIVMATHGRGFISHAILGSTAERVLRRAPCPVLVVRDVRVKD